MPQILLVDDEPSLRKALSDRLSAEGYAVSTAANGVDGERMARQGDYDVIILDLMLPMKDGLEVCRNLRRDGHANPVLMLTARDEVRDKVMGFKSGADDYVTKPFDSTELLARVEALLRRARNAESPTDEVRFGDVVVRARARQVLRHGEEVRLSALEFKLLCHFVRNAGVVFSRDALLDAVWGYEATPETRTVDVHVGWLRQKLEGNPRQPKHLITVYGLGYRFEP
jgi:two-component system alkaline phosphatase synthesis response regulator PhoP